MVSHYNEVLTDSSIPQLILPAFCDFVFACCIPKIARENQVVILSKFLLFRVKIKTQISNKVYKTICELAQSNVFLSS